MAKLRWSLRNEDRTYAGHRGHVSARCILIVSDGAGKQQTTQYLQPQPLPFCDIGKLDGGTATAPREMGRYVSPRQPSTNWGGGGRR